MDLQTKVMFITTFFTAATLFVAMYGVRHYGNK